MLHTSMEFLNPFETKHSAVDWGHWLKVFGGFLDHEKGSHKVRHPIKNVT